MGLKYGRSEAKSAARELLRGIITAPTLPITADGDVDEAGLRHDVRHMIDTIRASGLYVNGYYGHFWLLSNAQRRQVIEIVVDEVAGAVPIICRCAHPSPREAVELALHAQGLGVDFISLVAPQFGGAHPDVLVEYVRAIAEEIELGISIFNTPQQGYLISPAMMAELAKIDNVCALKNGAPIAHTIAVRELVGDAIIVVDPEEQNLFLNMSQFGQKTIYTGANTMYDSARATPMRDYVDAALDGRIDDAARLYYAMQPLRDLHMKWVVNPWAATGVCPVAVVKEWQSLLGMTGGPVPRGLPTMPEAAKEELRADLARVGLIDK